MNDQAKFTVTLEFETDGANAEINNLRKLQEAVDGVSRRNGLSEKSQLSLSRALDRTGKAAGATADQQKTATQQQIIASQQTALYNQYLYDQEKGLKKAAEGTISLRYANYDLANTLFGVSAAITAVGAASLAAFASQERAFTDVERTLQTNVLPEQVAEIEEALKSLSTQIPLTFNQLSEIATIGNQMGIEADNIVDFTNTIARFSAITGISIESTTKAFGGFMAQTGMAPELLENLGSAIAKVGIDSNATEEQILSLMREITAGATGAGFAAEQIVALSGTLASLQIAPERARGSLTTYFETLNKAVAGGGEDLENFARIVGVTGDELERMVRSGEGNRVLRGFLEGLQDLDNIDTTRALDDLGLAQLRVTDTFRRLSGSLQLYDRDQQNANTAFQQSTELQRQYAMIVDDLASKFQILLNALMNFGAQVGEVLAPAFGRLIDLTVGGLKALTDFAQSPVGEALVRITATVAGALAVWAALRGVIALATASAYAFSFIVRGLGGAGIGSALVGMIKAFAGIKTAADGATASTLTLRGALLALGRAVIIGAIFSYVAEWIFNTGEAAVSAGNAIGNFADFLLQTGQAINDFFGWGDASTDPVYKAIRGWSNGLKSWGKDLIAQKRNSDEALKGVGALSGGLDELDRLLEEVANNSGGAAGGIGDVGNAAAAAAQQIRTLVDYAGDLSGVWQRAFDIRFGGAQGLDTIRSTFISIRDAADEAAKRIRDLKNDISGLSSDIDIQEYFLSIAVEYGDTQRAAAIEADLAKKRAELADKTAELQKQQDAASMSLVGTSKGAIDNRQQILELVSQYQSYLQALAASGLSQGALAAKSEQLRQEFLAQAMDLGYSREELRLYEAAFIDTARIISAVPFGVTTDLSSLDPALLAIREFVDQANADLNTLGSGIGGAMGGGIGAGNAALRTGLDQTKKDVMTPSDLVGKEIGNNISKGTGTGLNDPSTGINARVRGSTVITAPVFTSGFNMGAAIAGAMSRGISAYFDSAFPATSQGRTARNIIRQATGFADGGYTGAGGRNEPAGIVHRGEYVIPKNMVNQSTGLPYADALGRLMTGIPGMASGGPTTGSGAGSSLATVALTPGTIQAIAQATGKVIVLDGRVIADSSANSYSQDNVVGRY